jgi:Protein of unknown function (DUF664)
MTGAGLLVDAFGRIKEVVHDAVDGLTPDQLAIQVDATANSIGWLVWHLTRIQDDHVAGAAGIGQVYADGWWERLGRPFGQRDHGYGHSSADVASLHIPSTDLLLGYHDAVYDQTIAAVKGLTDADFDRVVDPGWDPPVTFGVRLISVISDDLQHAGQAAFVRGLIDGS